MGKRRYSEVKQEDKLHAALSAFWARVQPYVLPFGILVAVALAVTALWVVLAARSAAAQERPWARYYAIIAPSETGARETAEKQAEQLAALAREYQGRPIAALIDLQLAQRYFAAGSAKLETSPDAAKADFGRAAASAEQLIADYPDHTLLAEAHLAAAMARLALRQFEQAADHFRQAAASKVLHLAALAQFLEGRCYENLGRTKDAREAYEAARGNQAAGWVAQQADFFLAGLGPKGARD